MVHADGHRHVTTSYLPLSRKRAREIVMLIQHALLMMLLFWTWMSQSIEAFSLSFSKPRQACSIRHPCLMSLGGESQLEDILTRAANEAEELRKRARELKAEADAMEAALTDSRTDISKRRQKECDDHIEQLFSGDATTTQLVERLVQERWSPEQLMLVIERLHQRQVQALGRSAGTRAPKDFQIGDSRNTKNSAEPNEAEWTQLNDYVESLLEAAGVLDDQTLANVNENHRWTGRVANSLSSRLKELRRADEQEFQRRLAASVNAVAYNNLNVSVEEMMRKSLGLPVVEDVGEANASRSFNISRVLEQVAMVPMWIPSSLLPFLLTSKSKLDRDDFKTIRDEVLKGTSFYCTSSESIPSAAIFRGNVRTPLGVVNTTMDRNQTAVVFHDIQDRLSSAGLSGRIQLFFWNDPEWRPGRDPREPTPKPVILALPTAVVPEQSSQGGKASLVLKVCSAITTVISTLAYSISCYALNPNFFSSVVDRQDLSVLAACLPVLFGVLGLQALHEAAHYFVAKRSGIKVGLPIPLPSFQVGTFGAITPLRSFPANRTVLLDFALSGPLAGLLASMGLMVGGVFATVYASSEALLGFPVVPVALLKGSYFVGSLLSLLAPKTMILPASQPIPIHPLFMIGFAGVITNALNVLPIGRLDGGRAYTAVFGSRSASVATLLTLILMVLLSLSGMSNLSIFWGMMVVLFQRRPEIPVRNEVTEVDDSRLFLFLSTLLLAILVLTPFPGGQGML